MYIHIEANTLPLSNIPVTYQKILLSHLTCKPLTKKFLNLLFKRYYFYYTHF